MTPKNYHGWDWIEPGRSQCRKCGLVKAYMKRPGKSRFTAFYGRSADKMVPLTVRRSVPRCRPPQAKISPPSSSSSSPPASE